MLHRVQCRLGQLHGRFWTGCWNHQSSWMVGLGNWCSCKLLNGPKRLHGGMRGRIRCSDSLDSWSGEVLSLTQRFKKIGRTEIHKPDGIKLLATLKQLFKRVSSEISRLSSIRGPIVRFGHICLYLVVALDDFQHSHIRIVVVILIYRSSGANR